MECNCANERLIPNVNTPKSSMHLKACPLIKSYLFYYEEAVNTWVPAPESLAGIIDVDNLDEGERTEIKFQRFDMTEAEFKAIPED